MDYKELYDSRRAITSYGIILFTIEDGTLKYLLSQRRLSISYIVFLRGKLKDEDIVNHVKLMTNDERYRCLEAWKNKTPEKIWDDYWLNHHTKAYKTEEPEFLERFMKSMDKHHALFENNDGLNENVWNFSSKGRQNVDETEVECALREFQEETTISKELIQIYNSNPQTELYIGTDGKLYRTIFYLAFIPFKPVIRYKSNKYFFRRFLTGETSQIRWMTFKNAFNKLDSRKQTILSRVNNILSKNSKHRFHTF